MNIEQELVRIERRLWTHDAACYAAHITDDAVVVVAGTGTITRVKAADGLKRERAGSRWAEVIFEDTHLAPLAEGAFLLCYRVIARRAHWSRPGTLLAASVYVRRNGAWKLAFHQQTPVDESGSRAPAFTIRRLPVDRTRSTTDGPFAETKELFVSSLGPCACHPSRSKIPEAPATAPP